MSLRALEAKRSLDFKNKPNTKDMTTENPFSNTELDELRKAKIIGVRAGSEHRFTGVWVVVVEEKVFVRSWNDKPTGWYCAFRDQPRGSIHFADREIAVQAKQTRSKRLQNAVSQAYAVKYNTKASQKWVDGFAEEHRLQTTLELVPV